MSVEAKPLHETKVYGLVAEFDSGDKILAAARRATEEGYKKVEAYTPFPIHGMDEALKFKDARLAWMIFIAGIAGAIGGFMLQVWVSTVAYPMNVGGKPDISWPNFIPVTFECGVLFASLTAVFGMFALNGLPQPYHPIFNAKNFERASQDKFFLCIEATDSKFDPETTRDFLERLGADEVSEVTEDVAEEGATH